jgi:hypothetical protein
MNGWKNISVKLKYPKNKLSFRQSEKIIKAVKIFDGFFNLKVIMFVYKLSPFFRKKVYLVLAQ